MIKRSLNCYMEKLARRQAGRNNLEAQMKGVTVLCLLVLLTWVVLLYYGSDLERHGFALLETLTAGKTGRA